MRVRGSIDTSISKPLTSLDAWVAFVFLLETPSLSFSFGLDQIHLYWRW
jgi:hypothetical protein